MVQLICLVAPVLALLFGLSSAASTARPPLICSPTRQPDGTVIFELSQSPQSSQCHTCWEEEDGTVIARDSECLPDLVQNLTSKSITLKSCGEYLHYRRDCFGIREEAVCKLNCSIDVPQGMHSTPVNTTTLEWCLSESFCPDPLAFGLTLGFIIVFVLAAFSLGVCKWKRNFKRRQQDAAQRAVENEDEREEAIELCTQYKEENTVKIQRTAGIGLQQD
ncbi:uncharacterized protein LOC121512453 [Cheilinus undulatus]|uniref:uncharacterized protein LOC121512453 n=1 Tax=Cheilinus undulatus TaxID=241271 RepID=UPI001BD4DFF6|nr:uncharacterized protein LOC121512453 [Cheilinus undulatus]